MIKGLLGRGLDGEYFIWFGKGCQHRSALRLIVLGEAIWRYYPLEGKRPTLLGAFGLYLNACSLAVHRVNGAVIRVEGDLKSTHNLGKSCAKAGRTGRSGSLA